MTVQCEQWIMKISKKNFDSFDIVCEYSCVAKSSLELKLGKCQRKAIYNFYHWGGFLKGWQWWWRIEGWTMEDRSAITIGAEMESRKEMLVVLKLHSPWCLIFDKFDQIKVFNYWKWYPVDIWLRWWVAGFSLILNIWHICMRLMSSNIESGPTLIFGSGGG